jgi:hypothetical protein
MGRAHAAALGCACLQGTLRGTPADHPQGRDRVLSVYPSLESAEIGQSLTPRLPDPGAQP